MPGETPVSYSRNVPLSTSPRQTRKVAVCGIVRLLSCSRARRSLHLLDNRSQFDRHLGNRRARDLHRAVAALASDEVERDVGVVLVGIVVTKMSAAALPAFDRTPRDRFRHR